MLVKRVKLLGHNWSSGCLANNLALSSSFCKNGVSFRDYEECIEELKTRAKMTTKNNISFCYVFGTSDHTLGYDLLMPLPTCEPKLFLTLSSSRM